MTVRRSLCITSHARYLRNVWCHSRDTKPSRNRFNCCHEDEIRILKCLRDIRELLDRFNPSLTTEFSIKSLLTLVVGKHVFRNEKWYHCHALTAWIRLQIQQDNYGTVELNEEASFTPFAYFKASKSYYPQVHTTTRYMGLPKLPPPTEKHTNYLKSR